MEKAEDKLPSEVIKGYIKSHITFMENNLETESRRKGMVGSKSESARVS
jgi:hypothetical protein